MSYAHFDPSKPVTSDTRQDSFDYILQNSLATRDFSLIGGIPGFNFEVSGGTAEQPAIMYHKNGTEWVRATITWGTTGGADGNPTVIVYAYSANSGGAWDTIKTLTIAYNADGNVETSTWS